MQISRRLKLANLLILLVLVACGAHLSHVVERGETLYSISWMYGYDYQKVAQWNGIKPPYVIKPGERLRLQPSQNDGSAASELRRTQAKVIAYTDWHDRSKREPIGKKAVSATATFSDKASDKRSSNSLGQKRQLKESIQQHRILKGSTYLKWQWPTRGGRLVSKFEASDPGKRGLDIAGNTGQAVMAAADGEVVYSGGGLPHYGKLIIVKHNDVYLSAYAHNRKLYVAEGDAVRRGQHIADMGSTGSSSTRLHFEIRRNGKPIDPLQLLPHIDL